MSLQKWFFKYNFFMNNKQNVPMAKYSTHVQTTTDYFLFKSIDGNRKLNLQHINRLKKSISENYLFTIITVNENFEIIDGQHRFEVIREFKLPLHYIVCEGYGLEEVHILNQNNKTWTLDDYLAGYCDLGYKDYLKYRGFKETYAIGHSESMALLSGNSSGDVTHTFKIGEFKVKDYNNACRTIEKIMLTGKYYDGSKRRSYIFAMMTLLKKEAFEFTEFMQKLKQQPTALVDCTTTNNYIALIEEIYNYRRREKVNLRF